MPMNIRDLFAPFEDELPLRAAGRVPDPPVIEWRAAWGDLFFRPQGSDPQLVWCDLAYSVSPKRPLTAFKRDQLTRRLSDCWATRRHYRVVPFPDGDDWALLRLGRFLVKSPRQKLPARWLAPTPRFAWTKALEFVSRPASAYVEFLDPQGDEGRLHTDGLDAQADELRLSRRFAALDENERRLSVLSFANGNFESWTAVVRVLFSLIRPTFGRSDELVCYTTPSYFGAGERTKISVINNMYPMSQIAPLLSVVDAHFEPTVEMSRWRGLYPNGKTAGVSFRPFHIHAAVSAHERMEAALFVRDFARDIGKQDEIEPILRELMG